MDTRGKLFYSKYCKYSKKILNNIEENNMIDKFNLICIDNRRIHNNDIYIGNYKLPSQIDRVPMLLTSNELLSGEQILDYIKPHVEKVEQINEPSPLSITYKVSDVHSDNYSFVDSTSDEMSASGDGGTRQMYNYSRVNENYSIITPEESEKNPKISCSLEQLEELRKNDIKV